MVFRLLARQLPRCPVRWQRLGKRRRFFQKAAAGRFLVRRPEVLPLGRSRQGHARQFEQRRRFSSCLRLLVGSLTHPCPSEEGILRHPPLLGGVPEGRGGSTLCRNNSLPAERLANPPLPLRGGDSEAPSPPRRGAQRAGWVNPVPLVIHSLPRCLQTHPYPSLEGMSDTEVNYEAASSTPRLR